MRQNALCRIYGVSDESPSDNGRLSRRFIFDRFRRTFLLEGEETIWHDGPLTTAVRNGAICYLDEVVEARKDTVVIIHPLTDDRRRLPIEKRGTVIEAPPEFMLVASYNSGYQSILKDLKQLTRQRFVAMEFDYPNAEDETAIVAKEGGIEEATAADRKNRSKSPRCRRGHGLEEGVSTRLLIYAAQMIAKGISPIAAAEVAICSPITDDREFKEASARLGRRLFDRYVF